MKLRYLRLLQLVLGILVLAMPVIKTVTKTGVSASIWFYVFEVVCMGMLYLCVRAYRCPHCGKQMKISVRQKCPHCAEPLDV